MGEVEEDEVSVIEDCDMESVIGLLAVWCALKYQDWIAKYCAKVNLAD